MGANDIQFGGAHYRTKGLQHWDICENYGIGYMESAATKYVYRHEQKNGVEDVLKSYHYTTKLIELHETRFRLPRGSVPVLVLEDFYTQNEVGYREANVCSGLFRWEDARDLRDVIFEIKALIIKKYPAFDLTTLS